ncbi:MAG: hypothetical protein Q4E20_00865 [Eubacteriales bacterium]|nr:hypothetical protein [Eubacteriales bacterium]
MDKEIMEGLTGFDEVWKRVKESKAPTSAETPAVKLMPRKDKRSGGKRFMPPK